MVEMITKFHNLIGGLILYACPFDVAFAGNWGGTWGNMSWGYQPPMPVPVNGMIMLVATILLLGFVGILKLRKR